MESKQKESAAMELKPMYLEPNSMCKILKLKDLVVMELRLQDLAVGFGSQVPCNLFFYFFDR